jgi:hypothetical protein
MTTREQRYRDPVIEAYKKDVDRTLLRRNLERTPTERIRCLMELQRLADEARRAGRRARSSP